MDIEKLIREIENQRDLMVTVSTGGPRIDDVNEEYKERRQLIKAELRKLSLDDPNPHGDLWAWHGRWSSGDLSTYASRRAYLADMYQPLIDHLIEGPPLTGTQVFEELTGWHRIDRGIIEVRRLLASAENEEEFQAIGLFCRELLITLGQLVYDPDLHSSSDETEPSSTDAKRMLSAYIRHELKGSTHEAGRRYARAALDLANNLQHSRTADFRRAALCSQATVSMINLIAVLVGRISRESLGV
jgi:hypothetical protein